MCRIYAHVVKNPDEELLKKFVEAFVESNKYDHYLAKISSTRHASHDDGWGLVAIGLIDGEPTVSHYKTVEPIFYETSKRILDLYIKRISRYDELYLVIHARKASRREPYGTEYAHPFVMITDVGASWFVHNGGADKKALAEKLGVHYWMRVDSELLGYYVMDSVLSCIGGGGEVDNCVAEAYASAKHYIVKGSALNTALLVVAGNKPYIYVTHWVREPSTPDHQKYFEIVSYMNPTMSFAGSISIKEYLAGEYSSAMTSVEPGVYRLKPGSIEKISDLR